MTGMRGQGQNPFRLQQNSGITEILDAPMQDFRGAGVDQTDLGLPSIDTGHMGIVKTVNPEAGGLVRVPGITGLAMTLLLKSESMFRTCLPQKTIGQRGIPLITFIADILITFQVGVGRRSNDHAAPGVGCRIAGIADFPGIAGAIGTIRTIFPLSGFTETGDDQRPPGQGMEIQPFPKGLDGKLLTQKRAAVARRGCHLQNLTVIKELTNHHPRVIIQLLGGKHQDLGDSVQYLLYPVKFRNRLSVSDSHLIAVQRKQRVDESGGHQAIAE